MIAGLRALGIADPEVRLRLSPALAYTRGPIVEVLADPSADAVTVTLALADLPALCGPTTALPLLFAEAAIGDERRAERLRDLFDLLHAPLLAALVDAHATFAPGLGGHATAAWEELLLTLAGLDRAPPELPRGLCLRLLPLLLGGPPSAWTLAEALQIALADRLGAIRARCEANATPTSPADPGGWTRLGQASARLGDSAVLGRRLAVAGVLRIHLAPIAAEARASLLPGGPSHRRIAALLARLLPLGAAWELALHLTPSAPRLGLTTSLGATWLAPQPRRPPPIRIAGSA